MLPMGGDEPPPPPAEGAGGPGELPLAEQEAKKDELYQEVVQEDELDPARAYSVHMVLFNASSEDPHYVVHLNGSAAGEVHLADQERAEEIRELFTNAKEYVSSITDAIGVYGPREILDRVHMRWYAAKVAKSKLAQKVEANLREQLEREYRLKAAKVQRDFLEKAALALEASRKNLFGVDNSLKDALYEELVTAGMPARVAVSAIEKAFQRGGRKYLAGIAKKASEWMDKPVEAMAEIANEIVANAGHVPELPSDDQMVSENIARLASNSLPLTTYGTGGDPAQDQRERYRAALRSSRTH